MHATHPTLKYLENLDTMHPKLEEMPQQVHGVTLGLFVQSPSHVRLFVTPMDCSTPGLPVPHHLPKFAQVHVHCISDANKPFHPLTSSSPFALNLSQHQGLLQSVGS